MGTKPDVRRGRSVVYTLHAHLVFVPKYRRKVFTYTLLARCEEIMRQVCVDFGSELREFNGEPDHIRQYLWGATSGRPPTSPRPAEEHRWRSSRNTSRTRNNPADRLHARPPVQSIASSRALKGRDSCDSQVNRRTDASVPPYGGIERRETFVWGRTG
jgi:REP element-mobilizing transposase RayT